MPSSMRRAALRRQVVEASDSDERRRRLGSALRWGVGRRTLLGMTTSRRFTGQQITVMVIAASVAVIAAPVAALAAVASFSSGSATTPAVSAKNTSSGSGAKAVYGNASASKGTTYGVYGRAASAGGYGVYSAGRLGSSGKLVCSHCVTGADVNAATLPTVPDASDLGGHAPSYYARIVPLSWVGTTDQQLHLLADVDGLSIYGLCNTSPDAELFLGPDTNADLGTVNYFDVFATNVATANGFPLTNTSPRLITFSAGTTQSEGTLTYRFDGTGRIVTINFHLYGANCELFGNVFTAG
jgi:hypothetical protein